MSTYNTNLNKNYCKSWGLWEAVREILQNAIDQQTVNESNQIKFDYDEKKQTLEISNTGSALERSTILMGKTSKEDDIRTIGQHGEGYKVALLVLTRLGKRVVVKNYKKNEKWVPLFVKDKNYDNEEVLKIKIEKYYFKRLPDHDLTFEIKDVTKEEWDSITPLYLGFSIDKDVFNDEDFGTILFSEEQKGKIYVNGLYVETSKEKFQFGYNLRPDSISLDRDRRSVNSFDLKTKSALMIKNYYEKKPDSIEIIKKLIDEKASDIEYLYHFTNKDNDITLAISNIFSERYGDNAYPVSSQDEYDNIISLSSSIEPIIVSDLEKKIITKNSKYALDSFLSHYPNISKKRNPADFLKVFLTKHSESMCYNMRNELKELVQLFKHAKFEDNCDPNELLKMLKETTLDNDFDIPF